MLRAAGDVIEEVLMLPGTLSSGESALLRLHMLPIDPSACGAVHVHIIAAYPYDEFFWKAYNHRGEEIALEVVG